MPENPEGTPITIPAMGVGMTEAVVLAWHKQPGDEVAVGDPVAEIETDKMSVDLESPADGRLSEHLAQEGDVVPVGEPIAAILSGASAPATSAASPAAEPSAASPAADRAAAGAPASPDPALPAAASPSDVAPPGEGERAPHRLSPRARRQQAAAAAPDAAAAAEVPAAADAPVAARSGSGRAGGAARRVIAARVSESWHEIPHYAVTRELLADGLKERLTELRASVPSATATDLMLRALAEAIATGTDGDDAVDLGIAVATDRGVMIAVIGDVRSLDDAALSAARADAVERARSGRMSSADLEGRAAATLSNLGAANVDHFTGIIPVGQTTLLTVGRARPRATVDEHGAVVARSTMFVTVNADHRVLDGLDVANLLERFAAGLARAAPVRGEDS